MDTYNFDEDLIEKPRRDPTPEPADDREVIECLWWTRSDWEKQRDESVSVAPSTEPDTLSVCPSDLDGRSDRLSAFGDTDAPELEDEPEPVGVEGDLESEFEDDEDRFVTMHESDAGEHKRSKASPESERASTSGTEGATSQGSVSVGGILPADGVKLHNHSHGSASLASRDKVIKSGSAAKGKKVIRPRHPGKKVAQPRKPSRKASKATKDGVEEKHFEKDSMGYADPIEVLEHLKRAQKHFRTSTFKVVFPVDQGFTVDAKGRRRCGIRGAIAASGVVRWVHTECEPCGIEVATGDSYRRHVIEAHFGISRGRKKDQPDRIRKSLDDF
ncbi:hypothetical protein PIIN_10996, partial [Serendipita indica DSM 11827]